MQQDDVSWPASRIVHLAGGCRAVNCDGATVQFAPNRPNGNPFQFTLASYHALFPDLATMHLQIIGADFYSHVMHFDGRMPPG